MIAQDQFDRTILPIAQPTDPVYTELDVRKTQPPPRFEVTAPAAAPNVVIILIDDLGFGATSTFGGPIPTPAFDKLANAGLRYNNFHTTGNPLVTKYRDVDHLRASIPDSERLPKLPGTPFIGELGYFDVVDIMSRQVRWFTKPERILIDDLNRYLDLKMRQLGKANGQGH